jgi:hypothetical protein
MKVLITGSRDWTDRQAISSILRMYDAETIVAHGGARGADKIAGDIAECLGFKVEVFEADWAKYGRSAGPKRNQKMLEDFWPDVVHAFPLAQSRGTLDMIAKARKAGIPVHVH